MKAELGEGRTLVCITDHPGFQDVALGRWTLRVAGGKYNTRNHEKYHQRESEEKYVAFFNAMSKYLCKVNL